MPLLLCRYTLPLAIAPPLLILRFITLRHAAAMPLFHTRSIRAHADTPVDIFATRLMMLPLILPPTLRHCFYDMRRQSALPLPRRFFASRMFCLLTSRGYSAILIAPRRYLQRYDAIR